MNVAEAIEKLKQYPPDAELHMCEEDGYSTTEVDHFYESTATYGLALPTPRTVKTVVATTAFRGL